MEEAQTSYDNEGYSNRLLSSEESTIDALKKWVSVAITDASNDGDNVHFVIFSSQQWPNGKMVDSTVSRSHSDFEWLHTAIKESSESVYRIIPPRPPPADFSKARDKFFQLSEDYDDPNSEDYIREKSNIEAEYLITFKKTVKSHELFLQRLIVHPLFKSDPNLQTFLQYKDELQVRSINTRERIESFIDRFSQRAETSILLATQSDGDEFFCNARHKLTMLLFRLDAMARASASQVEAEQKMSLDCVSMCSAFFSLTHMSLSMMPQYKEERKAWRHAFHLFVNCYDKLRVLYRQCAADRSINLVEMLQDSHSLLLSSQELLHRRFKFLSSYTETSKRLESLRKKAKGNTNATVKYEQSVSFVEVIHERAWEQLESISNIGKSELQDEEKYRVNQISSCLHEHAVTQLNQHRHVLECLQSTLASLQG